MKQKIAEYLLDINAVTLNTKKPYTWSSGIKSPIYCDNRLTLSYPYIRKQIEQELAHMIRKHYPKAELIIGTATAGIAHAAIVADILDLPMGYVRTRTKLHGKKNLIEGVIIEGQQVIVIEDLISTGQSSLNVVKTLKEKGLNVLGVLSIFSYNLESARKNFNSQHLIYQSLTDYDTLIQVALDNNYIDDDELNKLIHWKKNPNDEQWINI